MKYKCGNCKDDNDLEPCIIEAPEADGMSPELCPFDGDMAAHWKLVEEPTHEQ